MNIFRTTAICVGMLGLSFNARADFSNLDNSFGKSGLVTVVGPMQTSSTSAQTSNPALEFDDVTEGSDGNLYLTTISYIVRLTSNGTLDSSFGTQGYVSITTNGPEVLAVDVVNQRIYGNSGVGAAVTSPSGVTTQLSNGLLTIYAYDFSGNPVTSFGTNGAALLPNTLTASGSITGLQVLPSGNILAVGNLTSSPVSLFAAEITSAGALVSTFGSSGLATAAIPSTTSGLSGTLTSYKGGVDSSGNVYVVGGSAGSAGLVVRFTASGQLDSSFGENGILSESLSATGTNAEFELIEANADGSITTLGGYQTSNTPAAGGQSTTTNTQVLYTFSPTGQFVQSVTGTTDNVPDLPNYALQSDGKFVYVSGAQASTTTPSANVVRVFGAAPEPASSTSGGTTSSIGSNGSGSGSGAFSPLMLVLGAAGFARRKWLGQRGRKFLKQ